MESKACYIKRILKTLGICAIGLFLGKTVFGSFPLFENSALLTAIVFAGFPFGWVAMQHIFGGFVVLGWVSIVIYFVFKLVLSFTLGWAIMAYRFIKDIVQLIIVCRMERKASNV